MKTKGGIIIPDTAKEKPQKGEVVAVGPGKDGNKLSVKKEILSYTVNTPDRNLITKVMTI